MSAMNILHAVFLLVLYLGFAWWIFDMLTWKSLEEMAEQRRRSANLIAVGVIEAHQVRWTWRSVWLIAKQLFRIRRSA